MPLLVNLVLFAALAAVLVVLGMGLWNMFRGGSSNTSQKLMRLRVLLQFIAVILLMGALLIFGSGGPQ